MKILVADEHALVLAGIREVLEADGGFEIVATTRSGADVLPFVERYAPDVVLLDAQLLKLEGVGRLSRIRERHPDVKIVMWSMFSEPEQVHSSFNAGACGYITKAIAAGDLAAAIRQTVEGTAFHTLGRPSADDPDVARRTGLTERELTIVRAVARGLSNDGVAKELWITEQTVKFHLTNIYRKIGVVNRTEAARWAFAQGFA